MFFRTRKPPQEPTEDTGRIIAAYAAQIVELEQARDDAQSMKRLVNQAFATASFWKDKAQVVERDAVRAALEAQIIIDDLRAQLAPFKAPRKRDAKGHYLPLNGDEK